MELQNPKEVTLEDKTFVEYLSSKELDEIISSLASQLNAEYESYKMEVVLISILDGSFIFMADLIRKLNFQHKIHFVKIRSYENTESTGEVDYVLDLDIDVTDHHVVVVEDIIDTGLTIESFIDKLNKAKPLSVKICTLLSKPEVHNDIVDIHYIGKEIPADFVIGYGLDLNGYGRNLPAIYKLKV